METQQPISLSEISTMWQLRHILEGPTPYQPLLPPLVMPRAVGIRNKSSQTGKRDGRLMTRPEKAMFEAARSLSLAAGKSGRVAICSTCAGKSDDRRFGHTKSQHFCPYHKGFAEWQRKQHLLDIADERREVEGTEAGNEADDDLIHSEWPISQSASHQLRIFLD